MSAVVIKGGLVHYEAFGRSRRGSPPILFIHGWLGSWRYWMQTMESLAVEHRVYALDLWGFGDSDKSSAERFNVENYVALIENFILELGIMNPVIVGHALGAGVAIEYAFRNPQVVNKIVAVSLPLSPDSINQKMLFPQSSLFSKMMTWGGPIPNKEIEMEASRAAENAITESLKSFVKLNFAERLNTVDCNVLVVYGEKDDVVDSKLFNDLHVDVEHVRVIGLSGAKHFPMIDEGIKFNRLIKDFSDKLANLDSIEVKEEWRRRTR